MAHSSNIRSSSGLAVLSLGLALSACAPVPVATWVAAPAEAPNFASRLRCGSQLVTLGFTGEAMHLRTDNARFALHAVPAESGAKYEAVDDATTSLWNKGRAWMLTLHGQDYPVCRTVSSGAQAFRATGNEPGWQLDIYGPHFSFVTQDERVRVSGRTPVPQVSADVTTYSVATEAGPLTAL